MSRFLGTGVAMVTPFQANGSIDFDGLAATIEHLINGKVEYIVVLGTTAESATLSKDEKKQVFKFVTERVNGRIPLVAGIGGNNTTEVVAEVNQFEMVGYEAILSVVPYYNKPTQEGIYQHYKSIAQAAKLPIILYNVPGRTGVSMSAETTIRLAREFKNIIATKEASGSFDQFNAIMADKPEGFELISGDDPITLPMVALGAIGVISVVGNAFPVKFSEMVRLSLNGDFKAARPLHSSFLEFTRLCFVESNPCGVKAAMKELGIIEDYVRLPLTPIGDSTRAKVVAEVAKLK
ncbi:dihydrodipicolinate synthase [Pseudopedobacter saltans DSM 12145]|uniref:4-hydroxy-tetrahydrodipicolinate synthase n=1 Tax=Pseudopedobacter saltans (strain ATCC 51119 / DSM 12145 / JCM 21818 / CCUG 39354 / LMG 10337 / NBRC 100064 / NCIMB 13643) TaxID=762903 RepID=F0SDL3_PSESL|nr:4-hydroxy-tetrahydrodipicolinate synthase [Pseudopedobacter saltans]ADY50740.1 dihydrodipicolinate synthase [Pseudopedobacter saltans DSM 12145]